MRASLLLGTLIVACAAGAGLLLLERGATVADAPGGPGARAPETPGERDPVPAAATAEDEERFREWRTLATLREDLRDVLAAPPEELDRTFREVSDQLASSAATVLESTAPGEASPRVRALLVLAAGRHRPDDARLLRFLEDRSAVVREAAALAAGWSDGDAAQVRTSRAGVRVPTGRGLAGPTAAALRAALAGESDASVREAIGAVLGAR